MVLKIKKTLISLLFIGAFKGVPFASEISSSASDRSEHPLETQFDRSHIDKGFWSFFNKIDPQGSFGYFSKVMNLKSQRENWYEASPYIAEFACFTSNLAILGVGIHDNSYSTIFAGLMSAFSHAIPMQFTHDLDMLGVASIGLVVAYNTYTVLNSNSALYSGLFALAMNATDTILSRRYSKTFGPWLHAGWHLSAAYALHNPNNAIAIKNN